MKKHIANILSVLRTIVAVILLIFNDFTNTFLILYLLCGITDLIDGTLARKLHTESTFGAVLDTIGDVITYVAMAKIIVLRKIVPLWAYLWMGTDLIFLIISGFISKIRFKKFYFVHTLFGKIFGGLLFFLPLGFRIMSNSVYLCILCSATAIAAVESIVIQLFSKFPHDNVILIHKAIKETNDTENENLIND